MQPWMYSPAQLQPPHKFYLSFNSISIPSSVVSMIGYSRKLCNHRYAIALFVAAYNFCKVHSTLGCTPAVGVKLTNEAWTIERLIEEATKSNGVCG
jgi:hypothetical protein